MITRRTFGLAAASFGCAGLVSGQAAADNYPSQFIKVVIPNPPAGPGDVIARVFTAHATEAIGQSFVFDYRAGASTVIGTQFAARSAPDGYTILGFPSSGLAVTLLKKNIPYNLETDFRPIVGLGTVPLALVVKSSLNFTKFDDFIAALKAGKMFYGSGGVGTIAHLSGAFLASEFKGSATHVAFRGNPEAIQGILAGNTDFAMVSLADAATVRDTPQAQILAVTASSRIPSMPNAPTMIELGYPQFNMRLWYAFLAPAKTPDDRIKRLYDAFAEAGKKPELRSQLSSLGFIVDIQDPDTLVKMMKSEAKQWSQVIETNHISVNE